jgi:SAM-dependent methyltransferase
MKNILSKIPFLKNWIRKLNNLNERTDWVKDQLSKIPKDSLILDAGCGDQQFKIFCNHLNYKGQDFGEYKIDQKRGIGNETGGLGSGEGYKYGKLDYVGDIWDINESDSKFDVILCTEVFEHIPYPIETLKEFSRLLKPGGVLLLTAPSNCLRHMDPYFFYSGFSDRWYEKFMSQNGFEIEEIITVGDYYSWLGVEMARTAMNHSIISKILLFPAFLYFFSKKKTEISSNTLCMGYHVKAKKIN